MVNVLVPWLVVGVFHSRCWGFPVNLRSGNIIICDRKIIMTCIRSWFGSEEHFEASVRSDVFAACVQGHPDGTALSVVFMGKLVIAEVSGGLLKSHDALGD